jgi:short-subunit dehydrogenase
MIERGAGKIINISSILGRLATPFNGVYAASKFALEGLSESMRTEVSPLGVHVALVEPGLFETEFQRNQVRAARADDPKLAYAPYVQRYNARHQTYDRLASDPVKVSKVIHKIIRSRRPALRHPVGLEAHAGIIGSRLIPGRLFQWMLGRATMR